MAHRFVVLRNNQLESYEDFNSIPHDFEHLIEFKPDIPPPPHSHDQHLEIDQWQDKLKLLIEIEKKNGSYRSTGSSIS